MRFVLAADFLAVKEKNRIATANFETGLTASSGQEDPVVWLQFFFDRRQVWSQIVDQASYAQLCTETNDAVQVSVSYPI